MSLAVPVATGRQPATRTISCTPSHLPPFAMRGRNRCRISHSIPASATSLFTDEAEGARRTMR